MANHESREAKQQTTPIFASGENDFCIGFFAFDIFGNLGTLDKKTEDVIIHPIEYRYKKIRFEQL